MSFINKIKEIYKYRHMLFTLVKQDYKEDIKAQYLDFYGHY